MIEPGLAPGEVPLALARLHRATPVGEAIRLALDPVGWDRDRLRDVLVGGGCTDVGVQRRGGRWHVRGIRARTLADTVGSGMRVLVCGLNPSVFSADAGIGFARPGNRFWPVALDAGLVTVDRDPVAALVDHGVGMTDLVKRATPRADALRPDEYRDGLARVDRLLAWLTPGVVVFVGLAGWRSAVDRRAVAGPQGERHGVPVYVMPSTSGLNARTPPAELAAHLRAAVDLVPRR
ncbi:MAG: mismatch-specific DNA-glycosylase [Acidimicrobiales bacterium]